MSKLLNYKIKFMANSTLDLTPNDQIKIQGLRTYEYKHIRLDYKGRGITQEINLLDIDGERIRSWRNNFDDDVIVPTLHEMLNQLGAAGWELVSHMVNQDNSSNGVTFHYYNFKRPLN